MYLGVDIGSTTSKAVVMDQQGEIKGRAIINIGTGTDGPKLAVNKALDQAGLKRKDIKKCVVTGYGRMLFEGADKQITEISCHAKGINYMMPGVSTIIDIGGQDAKVIRLSESGKVENFAMNEKCAAGTGRFLEVMARVLGCELSDLSELAQKGEEGVSISSVCTVFAESEMISQLSEGKKREDVALGAHKSIANRIVGLANRIGVKPDIVMSGGAALNKNLIDVLSQQLEEKIKQLEDPQAAGAIGAAVYAMEMER